VHPEEYGRRPRQRRHGTFTAAADAICPWAVRAWSSGTAVLLGDAVGSKEVNVADGRGRSRLRSRVNCRDGMNHRMPPDGTDGAEVRAASRCDL